MDKLAVIEIFSHGVRISRVSPAIDRIVGEFCKTFAHYKLERTKQGHWQQSLFKIYGVINKTNRSVLFHRNQYADFWQRVTGLGYTEDRFDIRQYVVHPGVTVDLRTQPHLSPLEHQPPIIEYLTADASGRTAEVQTGMGKAGVLSARIKIPGGWSTMGEMQVGTVVTARDGTACNVVGVYPQGTTPVYRVTFADGRSTECSPDHLWKVYYVNTTIKRRWRVVDTLEMLRLISMPNPRVYVPLCLSEDIPNVDLPIPPYTLGAILGVGVSPVIALRSLNRIRSCLTILRKNYLRD